MKKFLKIILILLLLIPSFSFAAIAPNAVWEIRSTADPGNVGGGFFITGASGSDFSQQNSPQYALTSVGCAGAGNTITHVSAATDMVGNGLKVISGTNMTVSWFEVTSVVAGVSITVSTNAAGTAICTGVSADGVVNIGGAISLGTSGASGDDDVFEATSATSTWYLKSGTYTFGEAVSVGLAGSPIGPVKIIGYNTTRGDNPTGTSRPTFDTGGNVFQLNTSWELYNTIVTGSGTTVFQMGNAGNNIKGVNIKVTNTSTTAGRAAIATGNNPRLFNCEAISYRGNGISTTANNTATINGCYIHDSNIGISTGSTFINLLNSIVADNVTAAVRTSAGTSGVILNNVTLYGSENKMGTGFDVLTLGVNMWMTNSIIYGFATGTAHADIQTVGFDDYNAYYNNTADVSATNKWQIGPHTSTTTNPSFTNVAIISGTGASSLTNTLTAGSAVDLSAIVDNQDFLYISSGTGTGIGLVKYLITSHNDGADTITVSSNITSSGAGSAIVWQVTTGHNFLPTGAI